MSTKRLLVVDDEENIRILFREELEDEGYDVELASNGIEALEKFRGSAFDVVILDIKMPGMDGLQALEEIKKFKKDQPVILCSAYGEYRQDFSTWISEAYVVKSADTTELKQAIKNVLRPS
jgi:CheY-like chemotaxis protein